MNGSNKRNLSIIVFTIVFIEIGFQPQFDQNPVQMVVKHKLGYS